MGKSSPGLDFEDPEISVMLDELGEELQKQKPVDKVKESAMVDKYLAKKALDCLRQREYQQRPEVKKARKEARELPENKAKKKEYNAKRSKLPHAKAKRKEQNRKYYLKLKETPGYKAKMKAEMTSEQIAKKKEYDREYNKNPENKHRRAMQRKTKRLHLAQMAKRVLMERERNVNIALNEIEKELNWENSESRYLEGWNDND
jgi:hypothetical protein